MKKQQTAQATLDTSGEIRLVANRDGWFVVGKGLQFPVEDRAAGQAMIAKLLNEPAPERKGRTDK